MNEGSQSDRKRRSIEKEEQEQVNEKMTVVYFSSKSQKIYAKIGSTNRSQNVNTESLLLSKKKNENPKKEQISTLQYDSCQSFIENSKKLNNL